jgi:uncharacterized protein YbaR (Trm112 family)
VPDPDDSLLDLLRCPFCGGRFTLHESARTTGPDDCIESGVIWCECCAFPIVAGIPVLRSDEGSQAAMQALEAGRYEDALFTLLGLDGPRADAFRSLLGQREALTYQRAIGVLSPDPEGTYFVYRFSDPTFVMAEGVLDAVAQEPAAFGGRVLDLCGGSGHLTRVLSQLQPSRTFVLADMFFWKLWLAKTFTAPGCVPVCCDANQPLPFARATFPTVVLSDAFPYIWQKRLLAEEMVRQAGPDGTIVMPHLHSSLGWNYSAGMTLTPRSYTNLFADLQPRLFDDESLFEQVVAGRGIDLSRPVSPEGLGGANSFTLIATRHEQVFRAFAPGTARPASGGLVVNPLYRVTRDGSKAVLTLTFPTKDYQDEFAACRRYLPDSVVLDGDLTNPRVLSPAGLDALTLRRRRILLDVPERYC